MMLPIWIFIGTGDVLEEAGGGGEGVCQEWLEKRFLAVRPAGGGGGFIRSERHFGWAMCQG